MRTVKMLASASVALALVASPVLAAPKASAVSLSKAVAAGPLRTGTNVRKSEKAFFAGIPLIFIAGAITAAIVTTVVVTTDDDDDTPTQSRG